MRPIDGLYREEGEKLEINNKHYCYILANLTSLLDTTV